MAAATPPDKPQAKTTAKEYTVRITVRVNASDQRAAEAKVADLLFDQPWCQRVRAEVTE